MTTLQTDRLTLSTPVLADFEDYVRLWSDPRVTEFLTADGKPLTRNGAWQSFSGQVGHWQLRGYGLFTVRERESGDFVGRVGPLFPEGWPDFEVGWSLCSKYWGRGYASEAGKASVQHAFDALGRRKIVSFIAPGNARSIRVAERTGEILEGTAVLPHIPDKPLLQYALKRD